MRVDDEESVREAQRSFWRAANRGDRDALSSLLDDAFLYVEADGLERKDKGEFIAEVASRSDDLGLLSFELDNVEVRLGTDMAVAFAQFRIEQEDDDERFRSSGNAFETFVRRGDDWKVIGSVFGEVPPLVE